ncbi:MAG: phosphoribosyltransferase family protein [Vulcanimicrobiota bacterium]
MDRQSFHVADEATLETTLDRIAAEVLARAGSDVHLVGIRRRGVPLAARLAGALRARVGRAYNVGELELKRYSDNLDILHQRPRLVEHPLPFEVAGAHLLVVDDVLYTGRSLLQAVSHLERAGAGRISTVVLCRRDGLEVPIRADFVGWHLEVGPQGVIQVKTPPYDDQTAVWIVDKES